MRIAIVCCASLLSATLACAQEQPSSRTGSAPAGVEEVLVTGEHPGPGLWRVSSGDNVLWILATHTPLPRNLLWRSEDVEAVIAESQQVLGPYSVAVSVQGADAYRSDGATLKKTLPPRVYSRWRSLKRKYIDRRLDTETLLPASAAILLQQAAFERAGLTYTDDLWRRIIQLAQKHRVPISTDHEVNQSIYIDPRRSAISAINAKAGIEYLSTTMTRLESELAAARARANAWAVGDIDSLQIQAQTDETSAYLLAHSWPFLEEREVRALLARADENWLAAVEVALTNNQSTFAALPIYLVLKDDGLLAKLKAAGYVVEEPL
jgi:uncharacterized protein YbaP (TraB family)